MVERPAARALRWARKAKASACLPLKKSKSEIEDIRIYVRRAVGGEVWVNKRGPHRVAVQLNVFN